MHLCANQKIFSLVDAVNFSLDDRYFRDHLDILLCISIRIHRRGVQRFDAHRFYFVNRMVISSHHFRLTL